MKYQKSLLKWGYLHKPNPNRMKPIAIRDVYTKGSAIAKYKFKPKVGSIILVIARSAPPAINNNVVIRISCLNPNPKDTKNRNIEGRPRYIPLCLSVRYKNPFPPCDVNVLMVSIVKSNIASNCKYFRNTPSLFEVNLICRHKINLPIVLL